jgi:Holliday junction resolvase
MTNSRQKGKRGEREVVDLLKRYGFDARRGQQFKGTSDSPDVIHNMTGFFIEVKHRQALNLYDTIEKADGEKPEGETSLIFHRKNQKRWLVTMDAEEFMSLMREIYDDGAPRDSQERG